MQVYLTTIKSHFGQLVLALLLGFGIASPAALQAANNYDSGVFEFQQKLAKGGNPQAQYQLATMYESGRGVAKDVNKAREWYKKSAAGNYAAAKHRLTFLEVKTGGFKNSHKPWVNQLAGDAKKGNGEAMYILGEMYEKGIGVKQDYKRAQKYYKSSASKGSVDAENRLYDIEQKVAQQNQQRQQKDKAQKEKAAKAREEAARKQKADKERKAKQAAAARAEQNRKKQMKSDQERKRLEAERRKLAEERRQLEVQRRALQAQKAADQEAAMKADEEKKEEKFESELCSGKAARFRTQCQ